MILNGEKSSSNCAWAQFPIGIWYEKYWLHQQHQMNGKYNLQMICEWLDRIEKKREQQHSNSIVYTTEQIIGERIS